MLSGCLALPATQHKTLLVLYPDTAKKRHGGASQQGNDGPQAAQKDSGSSHAVPSTAPTPGGLGAAVPCQLCPRTAPAAGHIPGHGEP